MSTPESTTPSRPTIRGLVLEALRTDHAPYAAHRGRAFAYLPSIAPFAALEEDTPAAWHDLAHVVDRAMVARACAFTPPGWTEIGHIRLTTLLAPISGVQAHDDHVIVDLNDEDIPAMRDLLARCGLGLGGAGAIRVLRYVGIFDGARLVAMAGSRISTPEWREISHLGTDPDHRGRGMARALIAELIRRHAATGRRTFLGVESDNPARGYYHDLGFVETGTERIEHHTRIG
jgi:ribosomal protein S18 acetylase RimI-like enzyme